MIPTKHAAQIPHNNISLSSLRLWLRFLFPVVFLCSDCSISTHEQHLSNRNPTNIKKICFHQKQKRRLPSESASTAITHILLHILFCLAIVFYFHSLQKADNEKRDGSDCCCQSGTCCCISNHFLHAHFLLNTLYLGFCLPALHIHHDYG